MAAANPDRVLPRLLDQCVNCLVFNWGQPEELTTLRKCKQCKVVQYCTESCQREHWKLVHKQQCEELASVGERGKPISDFKLLDGSDPLQDLVTQTEKILQRMYNSRSMSKSVYTKVSSQLDQLQKELKKCMLTALAHKTVFPKRALAFSFRFDWATISEFYNQYSHLLDKDLTNQMLWSTLFLVLERLTACRAVDRVNTLKTPHESVPAEYWVGLQQESGVLPERVDDLIKALSADQLPSFQELLRIFCGGTLLQTCSFCSTKMTVAAVFREVRGCFKGTPTVVVQPFLPPLFSCGAKACSDQLVVKEDAFSSFEVGLYATCARLSSLKCDYCFLLCEKVHR